MITPSGVSMMTVGEIIAELEKFSPTEVMTFNQRDAKTGETSWSVLQSVDASDLNWIDGGNGEVRFYDQNKNVVFSVGKAKE